MSVREATAEERNKLHRLGDRPVVALMTLSDGDVVEAAARGEAREPLAGP